MDYSWLPTVAEILERDGNQHAARLVSLVEATDSPAAEHGRTVVVLQVRPLFLNLFGVAARRNIAAVMDRLASGNEAHEVRVGPLPPGPFGPAPFTGAPNLTEQLREATASALAEVKSYNLPAACVRFGLADGDDQEAFNGKARYVLTRLQDHTAEELLDLGVRVVEEHYLPVLWGVLQVLQAQRGGVASAFKNLIFAANGPKPDLVLKDAISNTIEIVNHAEFCLVYDRLLSDAGLSWDDLARWWSARTAITDEHAAAFALYRRLFQSLDAGRDPSAGRGPEAITFRLYAELITEHGGRLPALIPQVYLHYDPQTQAHRRAAGPLPRQRMDFLLLLRGRRRVVIEIDGKQHYSDGDRSSPQRYAEMVCEDRALRLAGYEMFRFGGAEFTDRDRARSMLRQFFEQVLAQHGYLEPPAA